MNKSIMKKSPFKNIHHLGVVVSDLDKAIQHYQRMGIGPFQATGLTIVRRKVDGKLIDASSIANKTRQAKMGSILLELIQPLKGDPSVSLWMKSLKEKGDCVHHLAFLVDNLDLEIDNLEKSGVQIIYESRYKEGGGAAYFDREGIVYLELIQLPS